MEPDIQHSQSQFWNGSENNHSVLLGIESFALGFTLNPSVFAKLA